MLIEGSVIYFFLLLFLSEQKVRKENGFSILSISTPASKIIIPKKEKKMKWKTIRKQDGVKTELLLRKP